MREVCPQTQKTILRVWLPGCPLFRSNFVLKSHVGSLNGVLCPESRSVRFLGGSVLQFQSVTRSVSAVGRLSASRRVRYRRFNCIYYISVHKFIFGAKAKGRMRMRSNGNIPVLINLLTVDVVIIHLQLCTSKKGYPPASTSNECWSEAKSSCIF